MTSEKEEKIEVKEGKNMKPSWVKIKPEELEKIVVSLAKEGKKPAEIGMILRDKHGIPGAKLLGRKITKILKDAGVEYISEKQQVKERIEKLQKHVTKNKHDYSASRSLTKELWVLRKLET